MLYISINFSGIQYLSTNNLLMGFWRTNKEQSKNRKNKESAASELSFGRFKFITFMFQALTITLLLR